ncbi:GATA zinc finger domain-containing protein 14-like [Helicoverpa zea]|uniref:GATA zinc finger domain-containing protein 14-like n=1 Tax=Helicoverpa zea TaxID=7113 RepID=UPI001F5713F0|nr:GATA zinc finger domain-containing protein 14-like [Helicoverpa zea]
MRRNTAENQNLSSIPKIIQMPGKHIATDDLIKQFELKNKKVEPILRLKEKVIAGNSTIHKKIDTKDDNLENITVKNNNPNPKEINVIQSKINKNIFTDNKKRTKEHSTQLKEKKPDKFYEHLSEIIQNMRTNVKNYEILSQQKTLDTDIQSHRNQHGYNFDDIKNDNIHKDMKRNHPDEKTDIENTNINKTETNNLASNFDTLKNLNPSLNDSNGLKSKAFKFIIMNAEDGSIRNQLINTGNEENHSGNVIPQIQTRMNNALVKKSFDDFKMVRRKTHFTLPEFDFNADKRYKPDEYQDSNRYKTKNNIINKIRPRYTGGHTDDYYTEGEETQTDMDPKNYPTDAEKSQIINLLHKQANIIRDLRKSKAVKEKTLSEFDEMLKMIATKQEMKKMCSYTEFTFETTTVSTKLTTTKRPSTVLTLFDETKIRSALKNDPQVKRILKIANLKRENYLKNVRGDLENN